MHGISFVWGRKGGGVHKRKHDRLISAEVSTVQFRISNWTCALEPATKDVTTPRWENRSGYNVWLFTETMLPTLMLAVSALVIV